MIKSTMNKWEDVWKDVHMLEMRKNENILGKNSPVDLYLGIEIPDEELYFLASSLDKWMMSIVDVYE